MGWLSGDANHQVGMSGLDAVRAASMCTADRAADLAAAGDLTGAISLFRDEGDGDRRLLDAKDVRLSPEMRSLLTLHVGNTLVEKARMEARASDFDAALVDSARGVEILREIGLVTPQHARVLAWSLNLFAAFRLSAGVELEAALAATEEAERALARAGPERLDSEIHMPGVLATRLMLLLNLGRVDEASRIQQRIEVLFHRGRP